MFVVFASRPSWSSASAKASCQSSSIEMWLSYCASHSALLLVGACRDPLAVVADAGRPPHVRHRVGVARVVLRVGPFGAQVDHVRDERLVQRQERVRGDEVRDVDRDRERDVVAAAVGAQLRVGLVRVREEVVRDLDPVLVLEARARSGRRCTRSSCRCTARPRARARAWVRASRPRSASGPPSRAPRPTPMRPRTGSRRPTCTRRSPVRAPPPVPPSRSPRAAVGG